MASAETSVSAKTGSAGGPQKTKIGLVLQGGGALGAYEAGAVKCLYDRGMECTIVAGASSGAVNAVTLAAAKTYPPDVLKAMWRGFIDPEVSGTAIARSSTGRCRSPSHVQAAAGLLEASDLDNVADNTPLKETLERLDWDQVRDSEHMRVFVSASDVENGETIYFGNLSPEKAPRAGVPGRALRSGACAGQRQLSGRFSLDGDRRPIFWDGGLTDNTPLKPVIDNLTTAEAQTMPIYVIDVNTGAGPKADQPSASGAAGVRDAPAEQPENRYA